ncbi:MAG: ATP synthase F1 subunit epsilon [Oscillospiraceae bacterium]|jgi:F-type H+-transporting ATPase subunit epsilon|nr:ATP synthase F1 subunit epsilon [Oscillospiraceae bacterium]
MKTFELKVLTPEREFFSGSVEAASLMLSDGSVTILAEHMPMVAPVAICDLRIRQDGEWREAFASEGFIEVRRDKVLLFLQTCEWPEEIDEHRAEEAKLRAEERLRQKRSIAEYQQSRIALSRAMERLKVTRVKRG